MIICGGVVSIAKRVEEGGQAMKSLEMCVKESYANDLTKSRDVSEKGKKSRARRPSNEEPRNVCGRIVRKRSYKVEGRE
jgi:hypothetical protein